MHDITLTYLTDETVYFDCVITEIIIYLKKVPFTLHLSNRAIFSA